LCGVTPFPEGVLMFGCIGDEGASGDPRGHAVLWVVYSTTQSPMVMRMTATEARLVQPYMEWELLALCLFFFWGEGSGFMGWGWA
jgi:hypothetical protein